MKRWTFSWWFGIIIVAIGACQSFGGEEQEDRLLAEVHNKALYLSEMDGMFPPGTTSEDSALIIDNYVNRWIREALLLYEAERSIPSDLNIDKLVRDYRASLIRHNYEKILVEELLDSTVTADEIITFYEEHQQQFQLESPIVRCYFVKVSRSAPDQEELQTLWRNSNDPERYQQLVDYCNQYANLHLLADSTWYRIEDIAVELPPGTISTSNVSRQAIEKQDDSYQYFLRIFEVKNRNEVAPLSFVDDQVRKIILRNRKIKLLEDKKEEMFELEMRRNNIQLYTQ